MAKLEDLKVGDLVIMKNHKIIRHVYRVCRFFDSSGRILVNIVDISTGSERDVSPAYIERLIRESSIPIRPENNGIETGPVIIERR